MIRRALRQALVLAALALGPALVCGAVQFQWRHEEPLLPGEVRVATAKLWGKSVFWVDARPRARYEAGHIPGALLLNDEEWETQERAFVDAWEPDQTVIVYCDGGGCEASKEVAERLRDRLGIRSVFVLKGGWPAWRHE